MRETSKYLGKAKLKDMIAGLDEALELVEKEDYEGAIELLGNKYRIGPNTKDPKGRNLLFLTLEDYTFKNISGTKIFTFVKYLLKAGADVNCRDKYQLTVLHLAVIHQCPEFCQLLLDNGADPNVVGFDNYTPLDYSIQYYYGDRSPESLSILLLGGSLSFIPGHNSPTTIEERIINRSEKKPNPEEDRLRKLYYRTMEQLRIEKEIEEKS